MSILTPIPPETPFYQRVFYAVPVIGWIARDVMFGDRDNQLWFVVIVASLWLMSVAAWGVTALLVPFTLAIPLALAGAFNAMIWAHDRRAARRAEAASPDGVERDDNAPREAA